MKLQNTHTKVQPKGNRLKWTPIKDLKLIVLTPELIEGIKPDSTIKSHLDKSNLLVP